MEGSKVRGVSQKPEGDWMAERGGYASRNFLQGCLSGEVKDGTLVMEEV